MGDMSQTTSNDRSDLLPCGMDREPGRRSIGEILETWLVASLIGASAVIGLCGAARWLIG